MKTARERLQDIALEAKSKAAEAHSLGMGLMEKAACIAQLARMANSEETCEKILHALERGEAFDSVAVNSAGGKS